MFDNERGGRLRDTACPTFADPNNGFSAVPFNFPQASRAVAHRTGRDRRVRRIVPSTPSNGFLDRGNVDFLHRHHRLEGAFGFVTARTQGIGQDLRRDLP